MTRDNRDSFELVKRVLGFTDLAKEALVWHAGEEFRKSLNAGMMLAEDRKQYEATRLAGVLSDVDDIDQLVKDYKNHLNRSHDIGSKEGRGK